MNYEITSNVPIPPKKSGRHGRAGHYPFPQMKVGDSFLIPLAEAEAEGGAKKVSKRLAGAAYCWGHNRQTKTIRAKFVIRVVEDGVRCWRTE